jgi:hypothetical protein
MRQLCLAIGYAAQRAADWPPDAIVSQLCAYVINQRACNPALCMCKGNAESCVAGDPVLLCDDVMFWPCSALLPPETASLAVKLSQALVLLEVWCMMLCGAACRRAFFFPVQYGFKALIRALITTACSGQ